MGKGHSMTVLVGTSGWQYADWKGRFYPRDLPQARWLRYFSERFPTVEVNNTFYRLPEGPTFASWRTGSAEDFVIAVKASRFITHIRRLREPEEPLSRMWTRARRLGRKLGPVLFQLPPTFRADLDRLERLLDVLPGGMRSAFEFRHRSWDQPAVRDMLDRAGCALVLADTPGARVDPLVTGGWSYLRFHRGTREGYAYPRAKLRRWAQRIADLPAEETFVYFNNDPGGAAVRDAAILAAMLRDRGLTVPQPAAVAAP